mmetsp:Transcript_56499/g.156216  ORF Transcript_56499/g.156216 Transcript_56499/m.156216 type:complete len:96 (+) Transcript_56499:357-644(+)
MLGISALSAYLALFDVFPTGFAVIMVLTVPDCLRTLFKSNTEIMVRVLMDIFAFGIPFTCMTIFTILLPASCVRTVRLCVRTINVAVVHFQDIVM